MLAKLGSGLAIVALAIAAAVSYGVLHDQVTARVCIQYFTVGHPVLFPAVADPTALGLIWGVIATPLAPTQLEPGLGLRSSLGSSSTSKARK